MICKLCLAEPHRAGCPVEGNDLLARQLRYLPPDLIAEARAHHFPELRAIALPPAPPPPDRWRTANKVFWVAVLTLPLSLPVLVYLLGWL